MEGYDYVKALKKDIHEYMEANDWIDVGTTFPENYTGLRNLLSIDDGITGAASESYTCDTQEAKENVLSGGMDHLSDMIINGFITAGEVGNHFVKEEWDYLDVLIRVYLFDECLYEVLEEEWPNKIMDENGVMCYLPLESEVIE